MTSIVRKSLCAWAACLAAGCSSKPTTPQPPLDSVTARQEYLRLGKTSLTCLAWPGGRMVVVWGDIDGYVNGRSGPCAQGVRYSRTHGEIVAREKTVRQGEPAPPRAPRPPGPPVDPNSVVVVATREETDRGFSWRCETPDGAKGSMVIGDQTFDLAVGNLFLVATKPKVRATQLALDFAGIDVLPESFARLATERPEIKAFVAAAEPSK